MSEEIETEELVDLMTEGSDEDPHQEELEIPTPILIKPTIGRMVLFHDGFSDQPCAAQIAYVHDDYNINIGYLDRKGLPQSKENVHLVQSPDITCAIGNCEWMEYQKDQAK